MLANYIANAIFKNINALSVAPTGRPVSRFQDTIKQRLVNNAGELDLSDFGNYFQGEISCDSFKDALYNDLIFGVNRFSEQRNNVSCLIEREAQPAWVLVSAYYASFLRVMKFQN